MGRPALYLAIATISLREENKKDGEFREEEVFGRSEKMAPV
jgi:hypothetical protein